MDDLNLAITQFETVVPSTPDHPKRVRFLNNLAKCLQTRFTETGDINDLEMFIRVDLFTRDCNFDEYLCSPPVGQLDINHHTRIRPST